ncbi:MAG: hypothetical protein ACRD01_15900 [Terriglobales bacterium]
MADTNIVADPLGEEYHHLGTAKTGGGAPARPLRALCLSGGGIRSATFGLGVLQGLAEAGWLEQLDYLSTVSGGGYIGSWLSAWLHRDGWDGVRPHLLPNAEPPANCNPIGHLRAYNSYLTPHRGAFTLDTWTFAATVVRNVVLNWLVFIPLLLAVLMLPRLLLALLAATPPSPDVPLAAAVLLGFAAWNLLRGLPRLGAANFSPAQFLRLVLLPLLLAAMLAAAWAAQPAAAPALAPLIRWTLAPCLAAALAYLLGAWRRWRQLVPLLLGVVVIGSCSGAALWLLAANALRLHPPAVFVTVAVPLLLVGFLIAGALFTGFSSALLHSSDREWMARAGAAVALAAALWLVGNAGVLLAPTWIAALGATLAASLASLGGLSGWLATLTGFKSAVTPSSPAGTRWLLKLALLVFLALLVIGLAAATAALLQAAYPDASPSPWRAAAWLAAFYALASIMAAFININKFSLAGMYRDRLIRAYLGASNPGEHADRFTGLAPNDDIRMHALDAQRPLHVLNLTLNLVGGTRLAWQQRKARPFTVTPADCGSPDLGYRPSILYGGKNGITLGTAMALSGAALSPNMGYHSSPAVTFLMTLFNVRLGAWLGNPSPRFHQVWKWAGPHSALLPLVREALGQTTDRTPYVYLSDGGHFENLGLYEMVRRRCQHIVVMDAGCDPGFSYDDLANALRKIRIDFRVPITFAAPPQRGQRWAVATIAYSQAWPDTPDGTLVYLKPTILGNEAPDIASYHADNPDFPHQSTDNQWFDESQTESYRLLGLQTVRDSHAALAPLFAPAVATTTA